MPLNLAMVAAGGVSSTGQDKQTRYDHVLTTCSSPPAMATASSSAGDRWDIGPVSTALGSDGLYVCRVGINAVMFTLSGTTVTIVAQTAAAVFSVTLTTGSKVNIAVSSGRLLLENNTNASITPVLKRITQ